LRRAVGVLDFERRNLCRDAARERPGAQQYAAGSEELDKWNELLRVGQGD
jgi:hypothetical protein